LYIVNLAVNYHVIFPVNFEGGTDMEFADKQFTMKDIIYFK